VRTEQRMPFRARRQALKDEVRLGVLVLKDYLHGL
jgi:hypothetical protein